MARHRTPPASRWWTGRGPLALLTVPCSGKHDNKFYWGSTSDNEVIKQLLETVRCNTTDRHLKNGLTSLGEVRENVERALDAKGDLTQTCEAQRSVKASGRHSCL